MWFFVSRTGPSHGHELTGKNQRLPSEMSERQQAPGRGEPEAVVAGGEGVEVFREKERS